MTPEAEVALAAVRNVVSKLPCVLERPSHGEPTWFIDGKKSFAMFCNYHHGSRLAVWCAAPAGVQEMLIADDSDRFFRPPYVGPRGWIGIYLDREVAASELEDILEEAYRAVAPPKYLKLLDQGGNA